MHAQSSPAAPVTTAATGTAAAMSTAAQALLAIALGAFLVFGVGFSPVGAVHNAAHDARHSSGFPCH